MALRKAWLPSEVRLLIDNYDKPIQELVDMFSNRHSQSSINRKIMRLRSEGKIGARSPETVAESYRIRDERRREGGKNKQG